MRVGSGVNRKTVTDSFFTSGNISGFYPHSFSITPWMSWSASSGNAPSRAANTSAVGLGYVAEAFVANADLGDTIAWNVEMAAGTWSIRALWYSDTTSGIYTVKIDGTSVGSFDFYGASPAMNVSGTITGVSVPSSGAKTLTFEATGTSGSDYLFRLIQISGVRTA